MCVYICLYVCVFKCITKTNKNDNQIKIEVCVYKLKSFLKNDKISFTENERFYITQNRIQLLKFNPQI